MKEVVWVVGASASGKDTFIRNVLSDREIAPQFGWSGKSLAVSEASRRYIGQFEGDPIVEQREQILTEAKALLCEADVVLIKGQFADVEASRHERLKELLPGVLHRIIELQAPLPELVKRLKKKPWWDEISKEEEFLGTSLKVASETTANLKDNFELTKLDSSSSGGYRVMP